MRGETGSAHSRCVHYRNFNPLPSHEGRRIPVRSAGLSPSNFNPLPSYEGRQRRRARAMCRKNFNPLPSYEGRHNLLKNGGAAHLFQSTPLIRGETGDFSGYVTLYRISIHSPHTRGDSISLQKSIRIYVSLHNKTMIHRFSGLYKPLFAAQSPIFGVRSPRKSHDSFTFARPSVGRGITP